MRLFTVTLLNTEPVSAPFSKRTFVIPHFLTRIVPDLHLLCFYSYKRLDSAQPLSFHLTSSQSGPPSSVPHPSVNIYQHPFNQLLPSLLSKLFLNMLIQEQVMRQKRTMGHYGDRAAGGEKPPVF